MTTVAALRIGSRGSRLALAQADIAVAALADARAGSPVEVVPLRTRGDDISARRPSGGWVDSDGQFTRELEHALLDGRVDLVVHSFKDLPTAPGYGLVIGAVLERADARDCLITADGEDLDTLPFGARIGTSSPRRAAQLAVSRSDLIAVPIRGNVETRLRRLRAGEFDALILAAAGLDRLGIAVFHGARLPFEVMLPAPAQGALALECRSDDEALLAILAAVDHRPTRIAVEAERSLLRQIGGGCLAPLGALGEVVGSTLRLRAAFEDPDGILVRASATGPCEDAPGIVERVANEVLAAGAAP